MHRLLGSAVYLGDARWQGTLYLVDGYPGAVAAADGSMVTGELYRLEDPGATLEILDEYEECGPASGPESEYLRIVTRVTPGDGSELDAWIYLYNRPVAGLARIESGDFIRHQRGA